MSWDRSFAERNRAELDRLKALVARLSVDDLKRPVGNGWTVSVVLAHIAFWDRRVLYVLEQSEREGKVVPTEVDTAVNDFALPLWLAIPPHEAARLAVTSAEAVDTKLRSLAPALLEQVGEYNERWAVRALHRAQHIDQIEQALK